ncbi:hypothetical protein [Zavarzinia sp. CC-PAN008]|uniref:hypothetical protein n=1 Tax=Zavarzinia sp. CC-PAN008 TaxID=3243332 RepID=UPI003F745187
MTWTFSTAALAVAVAACGLGGPALAGVPALKACTLSTATAVEETVPDEFCARRSCAAAREGVSVCHCVGNDGSFFKVTTPSGERRLPLDWASQAQGLQVLRGDIDGTAGDEVAVALHVGTSNGLGVRYWSIYLFDGDLGRLRTSWSTSEFGPGSFAQAADGKGCEILATEFSDGSDPERGGGTYFQGRFYRLAGDGLAPIAGRPVIQRRLLSSFEKERMAASEGDAGLAQPALWLSHASVQALEQDPLWTGKEVEGVIRSETMEPSGSEPHADSLDRVVEIAVEAGGSTQTISELGEDNYTRIRFGDAATRTAYPEGYLPGGLDPQALVGAKVLLGPVEEGLDLPPTVWLVDR